VEKKPGKAAAKIRIEADGSYFQINQVCVIFPSLLCKISRKHECTVMYLNRLQLFNASERTKMLLKASLSLSAFSYRSSKVQLFDYLVL